MSIWLTIVKGLKKQYLEDLDKFEKKLREISNQYDDGVYDDSDCNNNDIYSDEACKPILEILGADESSQVINKLKKQAQEVFVDIRVQVQIYTKWFQS